MHRYEVLHDRPRIIGKQVDVTGFQNEDLSASPKLVPSNPAVELIGGSRNKPERLVDIALMLMLEGQNMSELMKYICVTGVPLQVHSCCLAKYEKTCSTNLRKRVVPVELYSDMGRVPRAIKLEFDVCVAFPIFDTLLDSRANCSIVWIDDMHSHSRAIPPKVFPS